MSTKIPGIGHNSNTLDIEGDIAARRARFIEELTKFATARRIEEALAPEQIGALGGLERLAAQRQSLLDNMAHFYAQNAHADPSPAVLLLITFYSDNNDGVCTLSLARMANFLSRSTRRISACIARLEEAQVIQVKRGSGTQTSRYSPWIHRSFGSTKDALTWIMDVRSPVVKVGQRGRPAKTPAQEKQGPGITTTSQTGDHFIPESNQPLNENPYGPQVGLPDSSRGDTKCENPYHFPSTNTTTNTTDDKEENKQAQLELPDTTPSLFGKGFFPKEKIAPSSFIYTPSDHQREKFLTLAAHWTSKGGMAKGVSLHRETTDELLRDCVASLGAVPAELVDRALIGMLATMEGKKLDAAAAEFQGTGKFSAFVTYSRKVIQSEYKRIAADEMHLRAEAQAQTARIAGAPQVQKPDASKGRGRRAGLSMSDHYAEVFETESQGGDQK